MTAQLSKFPKAALDRVYQGIYWAFHKVRCVLPPILVLCCWIFCDGRWNIASAKSLTVPPCVYRSCHVLQYLLPLLGIKASCCSETGATQM